MIHKRTLIFEKKIRMKLFPLFSIAAAQFDYSYLEYNYTYIDTTVSPQVGYLEISVKTTFK